MAIDCDSTNGTWINDCLVSEQMLRRGDLLKVGSTIFKFLAGSDVENQFHQAFYELTIRDGLTGAHNLRFFQDTLKQELLRAAGDGVVVAIFELDGFQELNDNYGHLVVDQTLKQVADLVRERLRPEWCLARFGGARFALCLPNLSLPNALAAMAELGTRVREASFRVDDEDLNTVTMSAGVSFASGAGTQDDAIAAAGEQLYAAKRDGGNQVRPYPDDERPVRRVLSGSVLLHRALASENDWFLLGFELANERLVVSELGSAARIKRLRELERVVDSAIDQGDWIGEFHERYVLAFTQLKGPDVAAMMVKAISRRWKALGDTDDRTGVDRALRSAVVSPEELRQFDARALDKLVGRLIAPQAPAAMAGLPFPLEAPKQAVEIALGINLRVKALVHAIEIALRFGVAIAIALVRDSQDESAKAELARLLAEFSGGPITMGKWFELTLRLFAFKPTRTDHPGWDWLQRVAGGGKKAKRLRALLQASIEARNQYVGHGAALPDEIYAEAEEVARPALDALLAAAEPLRELQLVSVRSSEVLVEEDGFSYELLTHSGPSEHFPVVKKQSEHRLGRQWCYLLSENFPPLSLSPLFSSQICTKKCGRVEIFAADRIITGPKDTEVQVRGLTTAHVGSTRIQWTASAAKLHAGPE